jgi:hypothetical protein
MALHGPLRIVCTPRNDADTGYTTFYFHSSTCKALLLFNSNPLSQYRVGTGLWGEICRKQLPPLGVFDSLYIACIFVVSSDGTNFDKQEKCLEPPNNIRKYRLGLEQLYLSVSLPIVFAHHGTRSRHHQRQHHSLVSLAIHIDGSIVLGHARDLALNFIHTTR